MKYIDPIFFLFFINCKRKFHQTSSTLVIIVSNCYRLKKNSFQKRCK